MNPLDCKIAEAAGTETPASRRILIAQPPFGGQPVFDPAAPWLEPRQWPCRWISADPAPAEPAVVAYRCVFDWSSRRTVRLHFTADESYELFLDGVRIGSGPEHGDRGNWFFDTYEIEIGPGPHVLSAMVKQLGTLRALARISVRHGLLCASEDESANAAFGSSVATWEAKVLTAIRPLAIPADVGIPPFIGPAYELDLREWPAEWWIGDSSEWIRVQSHEPGNCGKVLAPTAPWHLLRPSVLPEQRADRYTNWTLRKCEPANQSLWQQTINGVGRVVIPPHTSQTLLFDSQTYLCAHIEFEIEGGRDAMIELAGAEMIRDVHGQKGFRDLIDGELRGPRDRIIADGSHRFVRMPQWRAGRYLQVIVTTYDSALTIHDLATLQTGYPLHDGPIAWHSGDPGLNQILDVCRQTQLACAHETYLDCPYYEQLQYIGDVHMQSLVTYCLTPDARLVRKAIELFLASRHNPASLPVAAYPSENGGIIAPFTLSLISVVHDYALWRDDPAFIRQVIPVLRGIIDWFLAHRGQDGLIRSPFGWNFVDANLGQIPPGGTPGDVSGIINWQLADALMRLARLEDAFGEPEPASRCRRIAGELAAVLAANAFDPKRSIFTDIPHSDSGSEHSQILALSSGLLTPERERAVSQALADDPELKRTGTAFTHYLFETYQRIGRVDLLWRRLEPWRWAILQGFRTFPEYIGINTRSDCHAWSAHPLYHYFATILGIRPAAWGFGRVAISPQLPDGLDQASGTLPHPLGTIHVKLIRNADSLTAEVSLPVGLAGEMTWRGITQPLRDGYCTRHWA